MKKHLLSFTHLGESIAAKKRQQYHIQKFMTCFKDGHDDLEVKKLADGVIERVMEIKGIKDLPTMITTLYETGTKISELETKQGKLFAEDSEYGKFKKETNEVLLDIKSLLEKGDDKTPAEKEMSFKGQLMAAFETKKAEIDKIVANPRDKHDWVRLETKAVITESMLATIEAATSPTQTSLTTNTGFISKIRHRILTYLANVSVGTIAVDLPYAMWIEEFDEEGTAIFIAEGTTKTQLSVNYKEKTMRAVKIAVFTKITTEFLRNLPQLVSFIQNNLLKRLDIATEDGLFNGTGPGNEQLQGLFSYAVPFTGGGITGVPFVNELDVIDALGTQAEKAYHIPTGVFVSLSLTGKLALLKDTIGNRIFPVGTDMTKIKIHGMSIIGSAAFENEALANGSRLFVGGDLTVINVSFLESLNIQIGLDGNDFTQNKKTLLLEQILVQFVSANDAAGLITGNFDTAMGLIG